MFYFILFVSAMVVNYSITNMYTGFIKTNNRWGDFTNNIIEIISVIGCFVLMLATKNHMFWMYIMLTFSVILNACKYTMEKKSKFIILYIAIIFFVIYMITYLCVDIFLGNVSAKETRLSCIFLVSSMLEFGLAAVVGKLHKIDMKGRYDKVLVVVSAILPLLSLYVITCIFRTNIEIDRFIAISVIMIVINVGLLLLLYSIIANYDREINSQILQEQNRSYEQQMQLMRESYENVRSVKHDLKNSLTTIKNLMEAGKAEAVFSFINDTCHELDNYKILADTGNTALDGMLNYKLQDAIEKNIHCDYKLSIPKDIQMNAFDLSAVVGNLLDNAIRETLKTKNPHINVSVEYFKGSLLISVKNTYDKNAQKRYCAENEQNMDLSHIHGVGLKNVEMIAKKYQGELVIDKTDEIFTVKVICFLK